MAGKSGISGMAGTPGMTGKSGAAGANGGSVSGGSAGEDPQSTDGACIESTTRSCGAFGLLGTCAAGTAACKSGEWLGCPEPAAHDTCEPSNDDDCDGTPNGGCDCTNGMTQPCGHEATGICKKGSSTCTDSKWSACQGNIDPGLRNCASADDSDCDGLPDNTIDNACTCMVGTTRACNEHPGKDGKGICRAGSQTCKIAADKSTSFWDVCTGSVGPASTDSCDVSGSDDNCDGTGNGGCACVNGTMQACGHAAVGICKPGIQTCANQQWGSCVGNVEPTTRDCSSANDNDCDGKADNTIDAICQCDSGTNQACGTHSGKDGVGPCKAGSQSCTLAANKASSSWGACSGSVGPASKDSCDVSGSDDNCDGTPNGGCLCVNGATQACGHAAAGICKPGVQTCASQQWGACVGNVEPTTRDCTSPKDNDCDGKADNTLDGVCQCASGTTQACGTHPGKDGVGSCKAGSQSCSLATNKSSSSWGTCSGSVGPAAADTCAPNNDANCNNVQNEGCTCVNGATKTCDCGGSVTCTNGSWPACPTTGTTGLGCNSKTYCDSASHKCWITADAVSYTQDDAKLYCTGLTFQGSSDWTVPTRDELKTVTRGCTGTGLCPTSQGPGLSGCYLPVEMGTCSVKWWTNDSAYVWYADQGWWGMDIPSLTYNVRCVAPWPGH